jgi:alpha-L-rhamnosidase
MKTFAPIFVSLLLVSSASAQERPWQQISDPTVAQLAAHFATPPSEYSSQFDWGFSDSLTREAMGAVLDHAKSVGVQCAFVEPKVGSSPYLSPGYFDAVKVVVEEAKKRDMHIWFDDDGGYPSGFCGGKFTTERPDLRMEGLAASQRVAVTNGQQYTHKLDAQTICVLAVNSDTGKAQVLDSSSGAVNWTVPAAGNWEIALPKWQFRSGTVHSSNGGSPSLMDYLNPEAGKLFVQWTFDAYKQATGDELGKTVLGFRGDEPHVSSNMGAFNPWSPVLLAEFQKCKGYDLRPYLSAITPIILFPRGVAAPATFNLDETHRVFADFCDVWSDLYGENFFGMEGKWCAENHVEMQMHIEHEEILPQLAAAEGDFFKCMRGLQVPGIDTIQHQIWHDVVADFPKLASSATHLNGHPRAMCESFAAYNPQPDLKEAGWILNHLMVLGINRIEYMGLQGTGAFRSFYGDPGFPAVSAHVNRACYLLGEGRPAAQIGVYIPSSSFWFNDSAANTAFLAIVHQLLQHQRDLDYVDDYSLSKTLKLQGNELINQSGQAYRAILIPPVDAISKAALDRLRAFAKAGGKVVFLGNAPKLVMDKNFLTATGPADISWAVFETTSEITPKVLAALPAPDVATDQETTWLKYNHRRMKDADLYFFFNEGDQPLSLKTTVANSGTAKQAQQWDTTSGKIAPWAGATFARGKTTLPLELQPWGAKIVVIDSK